MCQKTKQNPYNSCVLISFPIAVIKYFDKCNLKEKGFILIHILKVHTVCSGEAMVSDCEAPGHCTSNHEAEDSCRLLLSSRLHLYSSLGFHTCNGAPTVCVLHITA